MNDNFDLDDFMDYHNKINSILKTNKIMNRINIDDYTINYDKNKIDFYHKLTNADNEIYEITEKMKKMYNINDVIENFLDNLVNLQLYFLKLEDNVDDDMSSEIDISEIKNEDIIEEYNKKLATSHPKLKDKSHGILLKLIEQLIDLQKNIKSFNNNNLKLIIDFITSDNFINEFDNLNFNTKPVVKFKYYYDKVGYKATQQVGKNQALILVNIYKNINSIKKTRKNINVYNELFKFLNNIKKYFESETLDNIKISLDPKFNLSKSEGRFKSGSITMRNNLTPEYIEKLNRFINKLNFFISSQKGGYYDKYIYYKNKYLELKKN